MKRVALLVLGYLWAAPFSAIGAVAWLATYVLEWHRVRRVRERAIETVLTGPFAAFMLRPRDDGWRWEGITLGVFVFYYGPPTPERERHERRHVVQNMALGPIAMLLHLWSVVSYRTNPLERDATRAEADQR